MKRFVSSVVVAIVLTILLNQSVVVAGEIGTESKSSEPSVSASEVVRIEKKTIDPPQSKPRPLFQHDTYPDAWRAAQESNRPILVYVSMPNCPYCVKMRRQVFELPQVSRIVSSSFETIKADRYAHAKLVSKLHIKWYPTTVLVGPNNKILDVIEGYADAAKFQRRLQTSLASVTTPTETQTR